MTRAIAGSSSALLARAVHRRRPLSVEGVLERVFSTLFQRLVYAQIWEDPAVDLEAMDVRPDSRIVTIASGGCNVLSYLTADPARIHAVDLNAAHVALNRLKIAALKELAEHRSFFELLGEAASRDNAGLYDSCLRTGLDAETRAYWDARDWRGRRRITRFSRNIYRYGLLGRCIGAAHWIARMHGRDPRRMVTARSLAEQRRIFDTELADLFEKPLVRWLLSHRAALFGLGIPPAQYAELGHGAPTMAAVVKQRLERLACAHPICDNYFAWQAFNRGYAAPGHGPLPPYLQPERFATLKARADRIGIEQISMTEFLAQQPAASLDRYVLLDAQDWMGPDDLGRLWREITRTARPGARVIFRTAGRDSVLPGKVPEVILAAWRYEEARSHALHRRDRSAIYGGFHLYTMR